MPKHDSKIAADATTARQNAMLLCRNQKDVVTAYWASSVLIRICAQHKVDRLRAELARQKGLSQPIPPYLRPPPE